MLINNKCLLIKFFTLISLQKYLLVKDWPVLSLVKQLLNNERKKNSSCLVTFIKTASEL